MKLLKLLLASSLVSLALTACSDDDPVIVLPDGEKVEGDVEGGNLAGFFVLNEGNMGANKCTLDFMNYASDTYVRNIYAVQNPDVVMELGDTGNDIAVYGDRLYIVVNGSHKVEVLDALSARRIGKIDINSPRYMAFDGNYMYVTSYVGGEDGKGSVVKCDLGSLKVVGSVQTGVCPEEMVITEGKLYAANSSDFNTGVFDNTISVIDLATFTAEEPVVADVNMDHLRLDSFGNMWVNSRGNYADISESLIMLKKTSGKYAKAEQYNMPCTNFAISGDRIYFYGVTYDASWNATNSFNVATISASGIEGEPASFITDGTESTIASPYCIAVQPGTGNVIITDAKNYVSSGSVMSYSAGGKRQWTTKAGDIPGHVAFLSK